MLSFDRSNRAIGQTPTPPPPTLEERRTYNSYNCGAHMMCMIGLLVMLMGVFLGIREYENMNFSREFLESHLSNVQRSTYAIPCYFTECDCVRANQTLGLQACQDLEGEGPCFGPSKCCKSICFPSPHQCKTHHCTSYVPSTMCRRSNSICTYYTITSNLYSTRFMCYDRDTACNADAQSIVNGTYVYWQHDNPANISLGVPDTNPFIYKQIDLRSTILAFVILTLASCGLLCQGLCIIKKICRFREKHRPHIPSGWNCYDIIDD